MSMIDTINHELSEKISLLKQDKVFYGTVSHIEKQDHGFVVRVDLFNQRTNEIDDHLLFNGQVKDVTYSFELVIETPTLTILGHKNELFEFKRVKKIETYFDTFEGVVSFTTNRLYDKANPFKHKKMILKVSKASLEEKTNYRVRLNNQIKFLEKNWQMKEKLEMPTDLAPFNKSTGVRYSQYNVGVGNCTYINLGGMSKGFFNLGYTKNSTSKSYRYTGFSRHKPDWVIISNLNRDYYCAAIRYGRHEIFSCDWVIPKVSKYNVNIIRLFYCILNAGGKLYMLKYKANASVCSLIKDKVKLEVYYTSEYDMNDNGLCLYLEHGDKYISFGNSDYNFMTKSLVRQTFDVIVVPHQGSKMKTKIHLYNEDPNKYSIHSVKQHLSFKELRNRTGFHIHRTDLAGTFFCKL